MDFKTDGEEIILMVPDPGHFHASLLLQEAYPQLNRELHVFAPEGHGLDAFLQAIDSFNKREDKPTNWQPRLYTGPDFFSKMIAERPGNLMIIAGNNQLKTDYIKAAIEAGIHVLADKPMAIDSLGFKLLQQAFSKAAEQSVLLYDIMTERYAITNILQRELSGMPAIFGDLLPGSPEEPAILKESVHHFFKYVSGKSIQRPAWYFDVEQAGNGIVDVTTHLIDLILWESFAGQAINYRKDIEMTSARRWPTRLSLAEFQRVTGLQEYPPFLQKDIVEGDWLKVFSNGEINFKLRDVHARVSVSWQYQAPDGTGDTHYSIMRGSKAKLIIRQGKEEHYRPGLYVEATDEVDVNSYEKTLTEAVQTLQEQYPGIELAKSKTAKNQWRLLIPEALRSGHEAHFAEVSRKFLNYLKEGKLPAWEVPIMHTKYYITTKALEMALEQEKNNGR